MSLVLGPFSPTATNSQFNDTLGRTNGAYVITNYTSYQLQFKLNTTGIQFICPPGFIRIKHKEGNINAPVEWNESLIGPLAILGTPGFYVEILQEGVDDIPPEQLIPISQIATQQPRDIVMPVDPFSNGVAIASPVTVIDSGLQLYNNTWPLNGVPSGTVQRIYSYSITLSYVDPGDTGVAITFLTLQMRRANGGGTVGSPIILRQWRVTYTVTASVALEQSFVNPITQAIDNAGGVATNYVIEVLIHQAGLPTGGHGIEVFVCTQADQDRTNQAGIPSQGGGAGGGGGFPGQTQYTGTVF